jgi:hypothetical protein
MKKLAVLLAVLFITFPVFAEEITFENGGDGKTYVADVTLIGHYWFRFSAHSSTFNAGPFLSDTSTSVIGERCGANSNGTWDENWERIYEIKDIKGNPVQLAYNQASQYQGYNLTDGAKQLLVAVKNDSGDYVWQTTGQASSLEWDGGSSTDMPAIEYNILIDYYQVNSIRKAGLLETLFN